VKGVVGDFIERRESDRIGLIVFGNAPYIQAPFSQDHDIVRYLLDQTEVRMAGPQTMLGDAIGFAITRFEDTDTQAQRSKDRVLILLTDGNDTGSKMPPDKAANIAKGHDITIHTIAVGDPTTLGEDKLDEEALKEIADETGGRFFHANDRAELEGIYRTLDEIAPAEIQTLSYRPKTPLFQWPLGAGVLLLLTYFSTVLLLAMRRDRSAVHV
jgi:Ca-activated chloride channel family protein